MIGFMQWERSGGLILPLGCSGDGVVLLARELWAGKQDQAFILLIFQQ